MLNQNFEQDLRESANQDLEIPKDYFWLQCLVLILLALGLIAFFGYTLWYLIQP